MDKLRIQGGARLRGRVRIAGAKNAALPALAATLLTDEPVELRNLPQVRDVRTMLRVLERLGATAVDRGAGATRVQVERIASFEAPYDLVKTMRASILALGPLVARHGRARVSLPGGCAIGDRPVNYHIEALREMGAAVEVTHGYVEARAETLTGAEITFPRQTVTGTENLMMAAALARGTTVLHNCAREPEVTDLAELLARMGASIEGAGSERIVIEGRERLSGAEHTVIPDRIEAGTYLVAAALAGDDVEIEACRPRHLEAVLRQIAATGVPIEIEEDRLRVGRTERILPRDLRTATYPGFPTDMQAQYMVLASQAHGSSLVTETIFERRFMHVSELERMGAEIRIQGSSSLVVGPSRLWGAQVMATDLRASACLVLAALVAEGSTVIDRIYHLDRGYEAMEQKLSALGAAVERVR
jgi:UDP-N-acetylglucosamine 1-carboxyvinyltransferase